MKLKDKNKNWIEEVRSTSVSVSSEVKKLKKEKELKWRFDGHKKNLIYCDLYGNIFYVQQGVIVYSKHTPQRFRVNAILIHILEYIRHVVLFVLSVYGPVERGQFT